MIKSKIFISVIAVFICTVILFSCSKESASDNSTLQIRMTDAPAAYSAINVDVIGVRVNFRDDSTGWVSFGTNSHIYNLLNFQNGVDTVLATGVAPNGSIVKEIRFLLGPNNTVVENGVSHPLQLSSQDESGLKIKLNKKLNATLETVVIDFDAAQSVVKETNGVYRLKPVLKLK